jgi:diguanylate cyclase (GGDEF)-like protein/PAS domain S-box-containing protein
VKDELKNKPQLIAELNEIRRQSAELDELKIKIAELSKSELKYKSLLECVPDVIWTMDISLRFSYFSPSVRQLLGFTLEEAIIRSLQETLTPSSFRLAMKVLKEEIDLESIRPLDVYRTRTLELEVFRKDGAIILIEATTDFLRDSNSRPIGIIGVSRDITQRKQVEDTYRQLAFHDQVTGMPNRALFLDRLAMAVLQARRNKKKLAVIMLDLDRFKETNDRFGHETGDKLLRMVGERLTDRLRESDTVSRMGGDEFLVLLPGVESEGGAAIVAEKLLTAFKEPFLIDRFDLHVSASIGIALYPEYGNTPENLIRHADIAMYRAKAAGRNKWQLFTPDSCEVNKK